MESNGKARLPELTIEATEVVFRREDGLQFIDAYLSENEHREVLGWAGHAGLSCFKVNLRGEPHGAFVGVISCFIGSAIATIEQRLTEKNEH